MGRVVSWDKVRRSQKVVRSPHTRPNDDNPEQIRGPVAQRLEPRTHNQPPASRQAIGAVGTGNTGGAAGSLDPSARLAVLPLYAIRAQRVMREAGL